MPRAFAKFWRDLDALGLTKDHKACALYCHFLCAASVTARSVVFHGTVVTLQPGQLVTSRGELAVRLGLTEKEVRRAIRGLENLHLVGQMKAGKYTVIYLASSDSCIAEGPDEGQTKGQMRARSGPDGGPDEGQVFYKEEERKNKERENERNTLCASGDAPRADGPARPKPRSRLVMSERRMQAFEQFWEAFAWKKGRGGAEKAWAAIPELTDSLVARICEAARKEAAQRPALIELGRTPKWAQGWISERRWEDDYDAPQPAGSAPYVPRGQPRAGMTWAEVRDAKNRQACMDVLNELRAERGEAPLEEARNDESGGCVWTAEVEG